MSCLYLNLQQKKLFSNIFTDFLLVYIELAQTLKHFELTKKK